jgi:hypothetical protein
MTTSLLAILPLAIVMVAGPQIISSVLLATSSQARANSAAYLAGVASATTLGVTIVYVIARNANVQKGPSETSAQPVDYLIIALLVVLMIRTYLRRKTTEPPRWMGKLSTATPRFSLKIGFLLFILMPTDILTMITVGSYLAKNGDSWFNAVPFILVTVLLVSIPLLILLAMGRRADVILPKIRDWMSANSWVVSEVVLVFFLVITISGLS